MMTKIKYAFTLMVLAFSTVAALLAQSPEARVSQDAVKRVEAYLAKLDKAEYTGTVMVAVDGKPVVSKGYGFSEAERRLRNSPRTIFDTGSVTKQFTAAAVLKLEMEGKLSTADKIGKYFPNVPADKADITIHHLLRHSSGLPSSVGKDFEKITESEFVEKVFAAPLRSPVGVRFGYSNIGYSLLALIVEKVSGRSYEQYLYENLWKPAGMEMTGYSRPKFDKDVIAVGYRDGERWGKPTEKEWAGDAPYLHLKGNGGVLSTTEDLLKWDRALATDKFLSKEAKRKYYFPELRADENGRSHYGYGWDVSTTGRGTTRVRHNGANGVFYADFYRFVDEGVTIIAMSNRRQLHFNETALILSKIIFDAKYTPVDPVADTPANQAFTEAIVKLALEKGASIAMESYRNRNKGSDLLEWAVNSKGYDLIDEKKFKEAIELFRLNVLAFPKSANAYDGLGEAYEEAGYKALAVENYKRALLLDSENEHAQNVLKRLEGK
jgi:CubicO group peptidase (beta-lactamase class C family)